MDLLCPVRSADGHRLSSCQDVILFHGPGNALPAETWGIVTGRGHSQNGKTALARAYLMR